MAKENAQPTSEAGADTAPDTASRWNKSAVRNAIGGLLLGEFVLAFALIVYLVSDWPEPAEVSEWHVLALVALAGALGSFVHAATSFATYVGNSRLDRTWVWWYVLRMPVGTSVALVFYFVIRGGLLAASAVGNINPFGVAAAAGLAGMFSKQAVDKLKETFDTLFQNKEDDQRTHKLRNTKPTLTAVEPATVAAKTTDLQIRCPGENLTDKHKLVAAGEVLENTRLDTDALVVGVPNKLIAKPGKLDLAIRTAEGATLSTNVSLTVTPAQSKS